MGERDVGLPAPAVAPRRSVCEARRDGPALDAVDHEGEVLGIIMATLTTVATPSFALKAPS